MGNNEVAKVIDSIADILQIKGEEAFKVKAYRRAAHSIRRMDEDIQELYSKERLYDISGVGRGIRQIIEEILEKGSSEYYEKLLEEVPHGVLDMLSVPGLGHKAVKLIYTMLGIENLEQLRIAAENGKLRNLPGMGIRTEQSIIQGVQLLQQGGDKKLLGEALPQAENLVEYLLSSDEVLKASVVGSSRRGKALVSDIDVLVASRNEKSVRRKVRQFKGIREILKEEQGHLAGLLHSGIEFEVIIVDPEKYYHSLIWTTGSKSHRARLYANVDRASLNGFESEEEIYKHLNLSYIPPELREDSGEFEASLNGCLPELLDRNDIKGDLHAHSNWSDGSNSISEMAEEARRRDYSYLAITDHSKSLPVSGGLNEERLLAQSKEIDDLNQQWNDFRLLKGIETDILKDGSLDFADEILSELDLVIASVHSNFKLDEEKQSERIIQAIKNENVDVIGHLSGRLLNRRRAYKFDLEKVLDEAARHDTVLEINSQIERLDIDESIARKAREYGIKISINSDAHSKKGLELIKYGVVTARRAWLEANDVINTLETNELIKVLKE